MPAMMNIFLIDRLELDLGKLTKDNFQNEFLEAVASQLDQQVEQKIQEEGIQENISKTGILLSSLKGSSSSTTRESVKSFSELSAANDLIIELLESFFTTGTLPWWYREEETSLKRQ